MMKRIFPFLLLALAIPTHAAFVAQNGIIASNGVNVATGVISGNGSGLTNLNGFPVINLTLPPYNADPTGIASATNALQIAIDTACFSNGAPRRVYIPSGDYNLSGGVLLRGTFGGLQIFGDQSTVTNGYMIVGEPNGQSRIHFTNTTGAAFHYLSTDARNPQFLTLQSLGIYGPSGSAIPNTNIVSRGIVFDASCGGNNNAILGCQIVGFKDGLVMTGQVNTVVAGNLSVSNWNTFFTGAHLDSLTLIGNEVLLGNSSGDRNSWSNSLAAYYFVPDNGSNACLGGAAGAGAVIIGGECGDYPYYTFNQGGESTLAVTGGNIERLNVAAHYIYGSMVTKITSLQSSIVGTNFGYFVVATNNGAGDLQLDNCYPTVGSGRLVGVFGNSYTPPVFIGKSAGLTQPAVSWINGSTTNTYNILGVDTLVDSTYTTLSGTLPIPIINLASNANANADKRGWIKGPRYSQTAPDQVGLYIENASGFTAGILGIGWDDQGSPEPQIIRFGDGVGNYAWQMNSGNLSDGGTHTLSVGGVLTAGGVVASAGTAFTGSGSGLTNVGFNAVTKTSNFTIPSTWVEATISNKGASGDTTNTLPPGLPGMQFTVVGEAAHFIAFKVQPGEVIHNFASSGFTNAWTSASAVPFANFTVKCSSAGVWWIQSQNGLTIGTQ